MAAQHAFDLGEPDTVARLVEQARDQTLTEADWARLELAQLVEQYDNFPLGGSDASVIAIAERRSITTILTTDRRHFAAVRPSTSRPSSCYRSDASRRRGSNPRPTACKIKAQRQSSCLPGIAPNKPLAVLHHLDPAA